MLILCLLLVRGHGSLCEYRYASDVPLYVYLFVYNVDCIYRTLLCYAIYYRAASCTLSDVNSNE